MRDEIKCEEISIGKYIYNCVLVKVLLNWTQKILNLINKLIYCFGYEIA
jgi:hypothetical protein